MGCPLLRVGWLSIEVNGRIVGTFKIVISAVEGYPLSGVPLYPTTLSIIALNNLMNGRVDGYV